MLQLLKKSPIYQYHALQIIIHSLLCYHSNVCMSVELASMARPTTCTPSTSGGIMESHVVGEPSVIMQIKPESIQSASCETSEAGQGIRYSDDFEYFSKEIPGLRSSDAKHPLLMRSISNMLAVPKTVWSQNLRFMCERFYTRGIEPDPNEQLALLQALHRFAKLCKMPVQATQTVLSALAKMELYATEDVKMIWFPQHQKTEELYVRQMIAHIDLLSIENRNRYDSNYAKFTRDQFELGDYGVRLKTKFGERCGKDLFIFWVSHMKLYLLHSKSNDAIQETLEVQLNLIEEMIPQNGKKFHFVKTTDLFVSILQNRFTSNLNSLEDQSKMKDFLSVQKFVKPQGLQIIGESYSSFEKRKILEFWGKYLNIYLTIKNIDNQQTLILGVEGLVQRSFDETNRLMEEYCDHMWLHGSESNILRGFLEYCSEKSSDEYYRLCADESVKEYDRGSFCSGTTPSLGTCAVM